MIAGIFGGNIDNILMRIADIQLAFPDVLLALAIVATTGPSLQNIILAIVITSWVKFARLSRASTLVVKELTYTEGARAIGASTLHILLRTILPNIATPLIILGTLQVGSAIITESALSFLGLGIPPPTSTWGGMLAEGREYLMVAWWTSTFPGFAIMVAVLGINLMGNGLRQILDPKLNI
jgi:peptide/nickel transport system permease protein